MESNTTSLVKENTGGGFHISKKVVIYNLSQFINQLVAMV